MRVVDVADPAAPRVVGVCPEPERLFDELATGRTTCTRTGPASYRSERFVFVTYFNAGLRVYDLEDPPRRARSRTGCRSRPPGRRRRS